jgi:hypothetical protein
MTDQIVDRARAEAADEVRTAVIKAVVGAAERHGNDPGLDACIGAGLYLAIRDLENLIPGLLATLSAMRRGGLRL